MREERPEFSLISQRPYRGALQGCCINGERKRKQEGKKKFDETFFVTMEQMPRPGPTPGPHGMK